MFGWLANAWRVPELRKRVLFTAGILAAYRLGSWVPAPGVDQKALQSLFSSAWKSVRACSRRALVCSSGSRG